MKKLSLFFGLAILMTSCDKMQTVIDIDLPPHDSKLVINSSNQLGKPFKVYISHSLDPLSNDHFEFYSDASVILFSNNVAIDTLVYIDSSYVYQSDVKAQMSTSYSLQANHPKHSIVNSKSISAPMPVEILSAIHSISAAQSVNLNSIEFAFDDPIGSNYYLLKLKAFYSYENDLSETITESYGLSFDSSDPSISNGSFEFDGEFSSKKVLFDDVLFDGQTKQLKLDYETYSHYDQDFREDSKIDSISVMLFSVDYDYFQYHKTRILQNKTGGGAIFGTEPVNVYNSFANDDGTISAYGLFSMYSLDTMIVKP